MALVEFGDEHRGLGASLHPQLGQQPGHVVLHGLFGQKHPRRDLLVAESFADERHDLLLATGPVSGMEKIMSCGRG